MKRARAANVLHRVSSCRPRSSDDDRDSKTLLHTQTHSRGIHPVFVVPVELCGPIESPAVQHLSPGRVQRRVGRQLQSSTTLAEFAQPQC